MNIRDLKYLIALSEHRHFGKAAKACFVSQPALSIQIKKLEEEFDIQLLERTNKSVMLTDIGMAIAEYARQILQQIETMREFAKATQDIYSSELKLGILPTLAPYLLPIIMSPLTKTFPKLTLYLVEEQTDVLVDKLKGGIIDAAFLALPITENNLTAAQLFEEEFLLATPSNHALAKQKVIKPKDLQHKNLILLDEGHCLREQALAVCHKMYAVETQNFRATSLETLRYMIEAGVGITLMPHLACKPNDKIAYIPFSAPKPMRSIGLLWRYASAKRKLLDDIAKQIRLILNKQNLVKVISVANKN